MQTSRWLLRRGLNGKALLLLIWLGFAHGSGGADPRAGGGLQVAFGPAGLERLTYQGQLLEDLQRWPDDRFHIWHMKSFDRSGRPKTDGEYGWGESSQSRRWDSASRTWTYSFVWGTLRTQYVQNGDTLDMRVTSSNKSDSGVVLDGASVYPLTVHLPRLPNGFAAGQSQLVDGTEAPGVTVANVTVADWGAAQMAVVAPDASKPVWSGLQAVKDDGYAAIVSGTRPDALPPGDGERKGLQVRPGETVSVVLSVRFAASAAPVATLAADAYRSFAQRWPQSLNWKDRRIIGTVYLASSAQGERTRSAGFPSNPRRYFSDAAVDVRGAAGLARFQARVLAQAQAMVENLRRMQAQGAITWDIEGEEYPQDTSYVCAPDAIAQVAPEMESVLSGREPRYAGMKLDDAYFRIIRDAGFRVGVCVRPQRFTLGADGSARQQTLPDGEAAAELIRKMKYAHDRWGATLFYADSTVRADGSTLPAEVLEQAAAALPDSLLIPEESTPRMVRATAPFQTFLFHGDLGTRASIRAMYPLGFAVNLVNDVDAAKLASHRQQLVDAVRNGDVLMVHADYWQANDPTVVEMYREAARR